MVNLDDGELKLLDPKNVYGSTEMFVSQCAHIWEDSQSVKFPQDYLSIQNIVVCGMGGSAYGGYVASALFKDSLKVPIISNNDYFLPNFVDSNTLVIVSSYSGSTEEVLSCLLMAQDKGCKIAGITTGGKIAKILISADLPILLFDPKYNPSGQPRLGMGYMVVGLIGLLNKLKIINLASGEVNTAISELKAAQNDIRFQAKDLAQKIQGNFPLIIAAEFLSGNAHIMRNQFNETAKSFSAFSFLPELNHHLMEGLKNPADKKLRALFINSGLYSDKIKKRLNLTKDVVAKNSIESDEYLVLGSSKLSQVLNVLSFGGYVTLYLAFLYGQDPSIIPWVDYFKEQLEK